MRLGAPVFGEFAGPADWAAAHVAKGYRAAYCPIGAGADDATVARWAEAAAASDLVIAEVGAWSNPLAPEEATRTAALENCKRQLDLAERIGARCCVNIAGSRGEKWDGPDDADLTPATFDLIVASVREVLESVGPERTYYTLEPMPYMYPTSADDYLRLLAAVDHPRFAVHFDAVNMINCPERYYATGALIAEFVEKLGSRIRSSHAKDVILRKAALVHLDECAPGEGNLDYATLLRELARLGTDTPLMIEHLSTEEQYDAAAAHIRKVADEAGVVFQ